MKESKARIELVEHGGAEHDLSTDDIRELLALGSSAIEVQPTVTGGRYRIKAASKVGMIATTRLDLLIRPKIDLETFFTLLEPMHSPIDLRSEVVRWGTYDDLTPAFAAFYARLVEHTLARGMRRAYLTVEEPLVAIRGRIDIRRQMGSTVATPLPCRYDEYSIDTPHNRILKAAALRLVRLPAVGEHNRSVLRHLLLWFGEVDDRPPPVARILARGFSRLDAHYEPAVRAAVMVLESTSLQDKFGEVTASSFLIDMNTVFQTFVETRLRAALAGQLDVHGQRHTHLDVNRFVGMRPDLTFLHRGLPVYVGDVKYKVGVGATGAYADLYQLLAYITALDVPGGVLVYAQGDDTLPPTELRVTNVLKHLAVRRLDLRGGPEDIHASVDALAASIVRSVGAPS